MKFSNSRVFSYHKEKGFIWFRIFGYGMCIKDWRIIKPLFSERNYEEVKKPIYIIGYYIIIFLNNKN